MKPTTPHAAAWEAVVALAGHYGHWWPEGAKDAGDRAAAGGQSFDEIVTTAAAVVDPDPMYDGQGPARSHRTGSGRTEWVISSTGEYARVEITISRPVKAGLGGGVAVVKVAIEWRPTIPAGWSIPHSGLGPQIAEEAKEWGLGGGENPPEYRAEARHLHAAAEALHVVGWRPTPPEQYEDRPRQRRALAAMWEEGELIPAPPNGERY